ncbi:MAG: hypothetical protein J5497_01160 [Selenomonadaceae bacterium]|nr:hypothetical protein [Selenomonadaceae bacterium]
MAHFQIGTAENDQGYVGWDKTQLYGLAGNDTVISDGKSEVLIVGGSGDDSLVMYGGNGTISGGAGKDTFELTCSVDKKLSAVIEDLDPQTTKLSSTSTAQSLRN